MNKRESLRAGDKIWVKGVIKQTAGIHGLVVEVFSAGMNGSESGKPSVFFATLLSKIKARIK